MLQYYKNLLKYTSNMKTSSYPSIIKNHFPSHLKLAISGVRPQKCLLQSCVITMIAADTTLYAFFPL